MLRVVWEEADSSGRLLDSKREAATVSGDIDYLPLRGDAQFLGDMGELISSLELYCEYIIWSTRSPLLGADDYCGEVGERALICAWGGGGGGGGSNARRYIRYVHVRLRVLVPRQGDYQQST